MWRMFHDSGQYRSRRRSRAVPLLERLMPLAKIDAAQSILNDADRSSQKRSRISRSSWNIIIFEYCVQSSSPEQFPADDQHSSFGLAYRCSRVSLGIHGTNSLVWSLVRRSDVQTIEAGLAAIVPVRLESQAAHPVIVLVPTFSRKMSGTAGWKS